jgi:hypothetical protein
MDSKNVDVSKKRSRVPIDRFADKQIHYIKVKIIILSVGFQRLETNKERK